MRSKRRALYDWFAKARGDLKIARGEIQTEDPATDAVCFHFQQAVERMLKAWLLWHEVAFPRTHNIEMLLAACEKIDQEFVDLRPAEGLTAYAVEVRYGDEPVSVDMDETRQAHELATFAEEFILAKFASLGIDPREPEQTSQE